jgi:hypothetical protein
VRLAQPRVLSETRRILIDIGALLETNLEVCFFSGPKGALLIEYYFTGCSERSSEPRLDYRGILEKLMVLRFLNPDF